MTIRLGVIGAGKIVRVRHLPEAKQNPNTEIIAVCDAVESRAQEMAEEYQCKSFTDYKVMLKDPEIDAVVVAATNATHAVMTIDALNAGKHVLCEKPMSITLDDARKMIDAAERNNKQLMIGHNQRLEIGHQKAREIIQSGKLGKVLTFSTTFGHPGSEDWAVEGKKTWFYRKAVAGLGVLGDLAIHKLDLVRWLLDDDYIQVSAFMDTLSKTYTDGSLIDLEDNALCLLKTKKGALGSLSASWSYAKEKNSTTIYCQNGVLEIYTDPEFQIIINYNHQQGEFHKLGKKSTNVEQLNSGVMDAFIDALVNNKDVPIAGIEGYKALEAVLACQESAKTGRVVNL